MFLDAVGISDLDTRYRSHLINCLSGAKSANLVGTVDGKGNENLSLVSSVVHIGAHPPLLGMVMRPHTVPRHTLENILETKCWTVNHVNAEIFRKAHQASARYSKEQSEFASVGLQPEYLEDFFAPFVAESRIRMGLRLEQVIPIPLNRTEFLIGSIQTIEVPDSAVLEDGFVNISEAGTVAVGGLDGYFGLQPLARLSYAKPDLDLKELPMRRSDS